MSHVERRIRVDLTPTEIGDAFAELNSLEQASALHAAWTHMQLWGAMAAESQLCCLADDITPGGKEMIDLLARLIRCPAEE